MDKRAYTQEPIAQMLLNLSAPLIEGKIMPINDINCILVVRNNVPMVIERIGLRTDGLYEVQSITGKIITVNGSQPIHWKKPASNADPIRFTNPLPMDFKCLYNPDTQTRYSNYEHRHYIFTNEDTTHPRRLPLSGWGHKATQQHRKDTAINILARFLYLGWLTDTVSGVNLVNDLARPSSKNDKGGILYNLRTDDVWTDTAIRQYIRSMGYWRIKVA